MSRSRRKWNYYLQRRDCIKWEESLSKINNKYLKAKVAAICWWDFSGEFHRKLELPSLDYLYKQMKLYKPNFESYFNREELFDCLKLIGYNKKKAWERSRQPFNRNGKDYK